MFPLRAFWRMRWRFLPVLLLVGVVCAVVASALPSMRSRGAPRGLLGELAREIPTADLQIAPRLSISPARPRCNSVGEATAEFRESCAPRVDRRSPDRIARIARRAAQTLRDRADPDAMHAAALIDLLHRTDSGLSLERSISSLQTVARLADHPAPTLADLSAAYLVRAERGGTPRDLAAALEAAGEALEREPRNEAALFNLALALQRFGLVQEAVISWRDFLVVDSVSAWAGKARQNLAGLRALPVEGLPPAPDALVQAYQAYAAADPQRARELGWCRVLGNWANATLRGDAATAESHLRRADALGTALEQRPGGDASLADGVRAIRVAGRSGAQTLARGHGEFAAGCRAERRVNFREATRRFAAAAASAGQSPTLQAWARLFEGAAVFHRGESGLARTIALTVVGAADTARNPALAARARLLLGAIAVRTDRFQEALAHATRARALSAATGEQELEGVALELMFTAHVRLGNPDGGYALAHEGLRMLRPYRGSYRLHNLLLYTSRILSEDGFQRAAVRVQNEGVHVAQRNGQPAHITEARLSRARLLGIAGAHEAAAQDVAAARASMAAIPNPDPRVREFLLSRLRIAQGSALLRVDAARAAAGLDSAVAFFLDSIRSPFVAFPAMVDAAHAHMAAGDAPLAVQHLEDALAVLERRRDQIRMEPRRAAMFEEARGLVDRITLLRLAAGRPDEALEYLDRGRASLATVGAASYAAAQRPATGPQGEFALVYARMADTLLAWTIAGGRVQISRAVVDTAQMFRTIERVRQQMAAKAGEAELRTGLSQLYDQLIRPIERRLGGAEAPLVVVADGELASIPFAALYDAARGRYLIENHSLRFAASLREARRPTRRPAPGRHALFVADPEFNPRAHPGFSRLPEARAEVRQVAGGYSDARLLAGAAANGDALRDAVQQSRLMHYAGHAVFDDERPERSYLLLAPSATGGAATLRAEDIADMDLHGVALVVLSACQTVRTGQGRAAGFSGLAGAFLAAGAGGALGSLWEVDDRLTRPLMVEFHRAYRASSDGPGALRTAQLRLMHSTEGVLRSPAAWAGFRYVGR